MINPLIKTIRDALIEANPTYTSAHRMTDNDVVRCVSAMVAIGTTRNTLYQIRPQPGDTVIFTTRYGKIYKHAILLGRRDAKEISLCEQPYTPWVNMKNNELISFDASGGAWHGIKEDMLTKFKYVGQELRTFCIWGHCGPRANGAIDLQAVTNVWQYTE